MSAGAVQLAAVVLCVFALPVAGVAVAPSGRRILLQRTEESVENVTDPANSTTIDGPDCGNVKQIFSKWEKAKQVGQVAGRARGVIANAQAVAGGLDATAAKVQEAGKALGENGQPPEAIQAAATKADQASTAITDAVAALETKLGAFQSAVGATEMSGADVTDEQVMELKDLTSELEVATRNAQDEVKALLKKAEEVRTDALKSSASALRLIKSVLGSATPLLQEAPDMAQKAKWAVDEAKAAVTAADKAANELNTTAAGDQAPVLEAAKSDLLSKSQAVADSHPDVTTAIDELNTATAALKAKVQPVEDAEQAAAGGSLVWGISEDLTAAEKAEADVRLATEKLRGAGGTLMARKGRLEAAMSELESKTT